MNQKGFTPLLILVGILLLLAGLAGGYYFGQSKNSKEPKEQQAIKDQVEQKLPSSSPVIEEWVTDGEVWVTYSKDSFDFTFQYPKTGFRVQQFENDKNIIAGVTYCDYSYDFTTSCGVPAPDRFRINVYTLNEGEGLDVWLQREYESDNSIHSKANADYLWKDSRNKHEWTDFHGYKALHFDIIYDKQFIDNYLPYKVTQEMLDDNKGDDIWVAYEKNTPLKEDYYTFVKGNKVYMISIITSEKSRALINKIANTFAFTK